MRKFAYLAVMMALIYSCSSNSNSESKKRRSGKPLFREQCNKKNGTVDQGACFCRYTGEYFNPYKKNCYND